MNYRRKFLVFLLAIACDGARSAGNAARIGRVRRVGILAVQDKVPGYWPTFVAELARHGYVENTNVHFDVRLVDETVPELRADALELARQQVDVILSLGGSATALAAKSATTTIPIVFISAYDPVGLGLVATLSHPGGNVTGVATPSTEVHIKGLQILAEATGKLTSLAFVQPDLARSLPWFSVYAAGVTKAARLMGIRSQFASFKSMGEVEPLIRRLVDSGVDGVKLAAGGSEKVDWNRVGDTLIAYRLPSVGNVDEGNLLDYSFSPTAQARTVARLVAKILNGSRPADLPVEQVTTYELGINLKTAEALGIRIPPAVLIQATKVIR